MQENNVPDFWEWRWHWKVPCNTQWRATHSKQRQEIYLQKEAEKGIYNFVQKTGINGTIIHLENINTTIYQIWFKVMILYKKIGIWCVLDSL